MSHGRSEPSDWVGGIQIYIRPMRLRAVTFSTPSTITTWNITKMFPIGGRFATNEFSITEAEIPFPSDTILFGEKATTCSHWYLDYETYEDVTGTILEQSRH